MGWKNWVLWVGLCVPITSNADTFVVVNGEVLAKYCGSEKTVSTGQRFSAPPTGECGGRLNITAGDFSLVCLTEGGSGCKTLEKGDELALADFGASNNDGKHWANFLIASARTTSYGGKRLDAGEKLPGFPSGTILKPSGNWVVVPDGKETATYAAFRLFEADGKTLLVEVEPANGLIRLPGSVLEFEREYRWSVNRDGRVYQGSFNVAYEEDQTQFQSELQAVEGFQEYAPELQALIFAAKAREWQYNFDMEQAAQRYLAGGEWQ